MLQLYRSIFACVVVGALSFAVARYSAPLHAHGDVQRVAALTAPQPGPASNQDVPLLSIDVDKIPAGMTARGTSFPLGNGLWLTARHVANEECGQVILIIDGKNVPARIKFLDREADLAVLQAPTGSARPLPIATTAVTEGQDAFAFGFPSGSLGAAQGELIGLARIKLDGLLAGTAPVLVWGEVRRYPNALGSLAGISGGPMLDESGKVVGIIVAASVRRGRDFTVAPEVLRAVARHLGLKRSQSRDATARNVVSPPVSLRKSAATLSDEARIAETYCIPR
jgi:serine protease Do